MSEQQEKISFSPPFIDQSVIDEVTDTLNSGWITTGPKVNALQNLLKNHTGASEALCLNSATSALMLALHWYGVGKGDEVIIPAYTYCATALVVMHLGAKPVMVDIKEDFTIDPEKVRKAITARTKVIIPVDIAGWTCDYHALYEVIKSPEVKALFDPAGEPQLSLGRILLLSDAAHSIGAKYQGRDSGSLADITAFSFHAVKNVTTSEGGALCLSLPQPFDNTSVYNTLRLWSLNGQTKDAFTKTKAGGWRYDIVYPGFKCNMPDLAAAMGLAQYRKYHEELLPARITIFEKYNKAFEQYEWALTPPFQTSGSTRGSAHLYPLRVKGMSEAGRDAMIEEISSKGIAVNVHFVPLPMLSVFREAGFTVEDVPVAYDMYQNEISLPIYPQLTDAQVKRVVEAVAEAREAVIG
ncbi:DegT/DnrJ/EryC1/StrS family aminotransferase [Roseivirga sp. BDSF3-8]|uniref:DegT/DnrJ/EryC1/StrS family aminotransferase n=1 Tax=Roseivirga sp. BDSF3-8 TaxID=3241598 RepID=UPI003531C624